MSDLIKEKEKNSKNLKILKKYEWFNIFCIKDWKFKQIEEEEIKEYDYIIEWKWNNIIIDRDKRKIRPYVEDLLSTMDIETKQVKLIRTNTILIFWLLFLSLFSFYFSYSAKSESKKLNEIFKTIQKVQILETQKNIIPNI
jgi:hypothetical protein